MSTTAAQRRRCYGSGSISPRGPGRWQIRWYHHDPASGTRERRSETIAGGEHDALRRLVERTGRTAPDHTKRRANENLPASDEAGEPDVRLPLGPPIDLVDGNVSHLVTFLGVHRWTVQRARVSGLDVFTADRWACTLGLHPVEVWGDAWRNLQR
jgi:hypothetical protein